MDVAEFTAKSLAGMPSNVTAVTSVKSVPVRVIELPPFVAPEEELKPVTVGAGGLDAETTTRLIPVAVYWMSKRLEFHVGALTVRNVPRREAKVMIWKEVPTGGS